MRRVRICLRPRRLYRQGNSTEYDCFLACGFGNDGWPGLITGLFHLKPLVASEERYPIQQPEPELTPVVRSASDFSREILLSEPRRYNMDEHGQGWHLLCARPHCG